jgi:hypothetical protein
MLVYLENANPNHIGHTGWGIETWHECHGETRSKSKFTFHIGIRVDHEGNYLTCILLKGKGGNKAVEGTIINWGPEEPDMAVVLEHYQMMFLKYHPIDRPGRGGNNNGGEGGSGGGGGGWTKQVYHNSDYDEYYYLDEQGEYQSCDSSGNPIYTADSTGHRTGNKYGLVLVFANSKRQTYYYSRGKQQACSLKKDSAGRYCFVDDQGRNRRAQCFGTEPRWMHRAKSSPPSGQSHSKTPSSGQLHSKQPSSGHSQPSGFKPKPTTSGPEIFTDKSGRKYYVGKDGKTHWV